MSRKKTVHVSPPEEVTPMPAKLWGLEEVAEFLQVKRTLIYNLMKHEGLPYIRLGSLRRFHPYEVEAWVKRQQSA